MKTPIVIIIYNRPKKVRKLMNSIKKENKRELFIIADGPKKRCDIQLCRDSLNEIYKVKWKGKKHLIASKKNLGLKKRIKTGLDKVFRIAERAIILEDDCIPSRSFFLFSDKMLNLYKNNRKIAGVTGNNFNNKIIDQTYYFSKYSSIWGWATWRRVWKTVDIKVKFWKKFKNSKNWKKKHLNSVERKFWTEIFDNVYKGNYNSWAYPYLLSNFYRDRLTIVPKNNLVKNVGFDHSATHTKVPYPIYILKNRKLSLNKIKHPTQIKNNIDADWYDFLHVYGGKSKLFPRRILSFVRKQFLN